MLLIEVDGDAPACESAMERVGSVCAEAGALDVLVAQNPAQRDRLWEARRMLSPATRAMARYKSPEDVVVPRTRLVDLLAERSAASPRRPAYRCSLRPRRRRKPPRQFPLERPQSPPRVSLALERLFHAVIAMRGTLSGERGIGTSKSEFLPSSRAPSS